MSHGKMNVKLLISLVSERKELFDKRDSDKNNVDKRDLLWKEIAEKLGVDVEEVKQKWRSMRDTYTWKKREEGDSRSGQAEKTKDQKRSWKYLKAMEFLAASTEFRSVQNNISSEDLGEAVDNLEESEDALATASSTSSSASPAVCNSLVSVICPTETLSRKRKSLGTSDFLERYFLSKDSREREKEERKREKDKRREQRNNQLTDDNYVFAIGLITKLRRLSPFQQSLVQLEISQLLHDAEFGQQSSPFFPPHSPVSYHQVTPQKLPIYENSS